MRRIFWGFCINRLGIGPLHYVSSLSDFSFEFSDIFVIEKRFPDRRVGESTRLPIDTIFFKLLINQWRIRSQNRNGSKGSVRDLWGANFCKNPRKSASLPCPFNFFTVAKTVTLPSVLHLLDEGLRLVGDHLHQRRVPKQYQVTILLANVLVLL
jgi:hypothetical protein